MPLLFYPRLFGNDAALQGGGSNPPPAPVLSILDNGNGTGATATITGSQGGSTNTVYAVSSPCVVGSVSPSAVGNRVGDGTVNLALADGWWLAYCVSSVGSLVSLPSNEYEVEVTTAAALAPSGVISLAEDNLRTLVSNSATFQNRVGCPTPACALAKVFRTFKRLDSDQQHRSLRPYAVVMSHEELKFELDAGGDKNYLLPRGTLGLMLTDTDRYPDDVESGAMDFKNFVGGVLSDLEAQAAVSGNLAITGLDLIKIERLGQDESLAQGIWWASIIGVEWQA